MNTCGAILLADDNQDDITIFMDALKHANILNPVRVVTDGRQAVDYLSGAGAYADREKYPLPFLIFLDLKLPHVTGFGVLSWIRKQACLSSVVVVVLSGSDETKDHIKAYGLGARSYLVKPPAPQDILRLVNSMASHWGAKPGPVLIGKP